MTRGGSRGAKRPSLSDLLKRELDQKSVPEMTEEVYSGSDRACALVCAAVLTQGLRKLIEFKLPNWETPTSVALFEQPRAPLVDMSARINVSFALGIIDEKVRDDLHRIRRVRNAFAHSMLPLAFEESVIAMECIALGAPPDPDGNEYTDPRGRFIASSMEYLTALIREYNHLLRTERRRYRAQDRREAERIAK